MPDIIYEIDADALTPERRARLLDTIRQRPLVLPGERTWLVRSPRVLLPAREIRRVPYHRWEDAGGERTRPRPVFQFLILGAWTVEAESTRVGRLARIPRGPSLRSLRLDMLEGRGDTVVIGTRATVPEEAVRFLVEARRSPGVDVKLILRSARGGTLATLEPQPESLVFDLDIRERDRVAGLSLMFTSASDTSTVFLDTLTFSA